MDLANIVNVLKNAKHVAILTGAGVSAESGIKTFRDPDGLWAKFNPAELASVDGFMSNPELVWEWYQMRRDVINKSKPNPGHFAIAEMEQIFPKFTLITQNVDRLHQQAGSKNIYELHGNIIDNHCLKCNKSHKNKSLESTDKLPTCEYCGGMIRPSVVWFGEMLPSDALFNSEQAAINCDVFFSIGTSAEVYPAANLPVLAKRNGAYFIEINPNRTSISSYADDVINSTSAEVLPLIVELLKSEVK